VKVDAAGDRFHDLQDLRLEQRPGTGFEPANHIRVTRAVETGARLQRAEGRRSPTPDLRLHYFSRIEKKLKGTSHLADTYRPTADVKTVVDFSRVRRGR
jgi:hypothetical protein